LNETFPIAQTAKREALEESAFADTGAVGRAIHGIDIFVDHHEYRGYFVGIQTGYFSAHDAKKSLEANKHTRHVVAYTNQYGLRALSIQ